ncbi:MHO_4530 family protein [Mycoplasma marinum]|uniref:Uncharacterized protein n=1 Tax=Mycoplasma marinum TaxID=1937190 RepID=A0A4R0XLI6_9MOLU|nr:hypothetical protein [Mycoplasma marinum]TCG11523.1 hypothetical protein C4B24_01600 [Mycoplasma marinum]
MVIAIITISIILILGMVVAILYLLFNKDLIANDSGKIMFEIDYKNRKIRNMNHPSLIENRLPHSQRINKFYNNKWMKLDEFTSIFDEYTNKKIRNSLHELENGIAEKKTFPVFIIKNNPIKKMSSKEKNKKDFLMHATLFKCKDKKNDGIFESGYIAGEIKFALPMHEDKKIFPSRISPNKLFQFEEKFIGLWVFNLRELKSYQKDLFFQAIHDNLGIKNLKYFLYENKLAVVIPTSSIILTDRKLSRKESKLEKILYAKGFKQYYDLNGLLLTRRISSPKKNAETIIKLDYLLWKSDKMNAKSRYLDEDIQEFQKYKEAYVTVSQAIKAQSMISRSTRVKKYSEVDSPRNKRGLINYLYPDIENIEPRYFAMVLSNPNMRRKMMDAHAQKVMESPETQPSILDVNAEWLIKRSASITNKKIIYMVEYTSETQHKLLFATIKKLQERKIMCGIRIQNADIKHLTTIIRIEPKFMIIDREVSKTAHNPATYVKLASIAEAAKNTYIIYELPSRKIDAKQRKVISLKFYYDYK